MKIITNKVSRTLVFFTSILLIFKLFIEVQANTETKNEKTNHYFKNELGNKKDFDQRIEMPNDNWLEKNSMTQNGDNSNPVQCDLKQLNFLGNPITSFTDFFPIVKNVWGRLNSYEIKGIFKFLDSENLGYFTSKRWNNFFNLFLNPFTECDADSDCILNKDELSSCFERDDMKVVIDNMPDGMTKDYLINEILFSLDNKNFQGLNFNSYLLLKRIIIGFRQFNVQGKIDAASFYSAIKTSFIDKLIDQTDSDLAFRVGVSLMYDQIKFFQVDFIQFFETCRIINAYISHDVSIGEGFLTKENLLFNFEAERYPSKINKLMFQDYYNMFDQDKKLDINKMQFPHNAMRFEDYAVIEFYANIFKNYTDPSTFGNKLNVTGFVDLVSTNRYIRKKYLVYISYSNFEDLSKMNQTKASASNITDYDFLTNFQSEFLEMENNVKFSLENNLEESISKNLLMLETKSKNNLRKSSLNMKKTQKTLSTTEGKTSVFNQFGMQKTEMESEAEASSEMLSESLFNLNLNAEDPDPAQGDNDNNPLTTLLAPALKNYFNILDVTSSGFLTFNNFLGFIKYLRLWDKLNTNNLDPRGIINTNNLNFLSSVKIQPKLALSENERLQNIDFLDCKYVDFLMFTDYMMAPKVFEQFFEKANRNYVNEINIQIGLRKLNLYADISSKKLMFQMGSFMKNFDYEMIVNIGLKNKCISNGLMFNITMDFLNNNTTQLLNSSIVDPSNVPRFNRTDQNIPSGSSGASTDDNTQTQSPAKFRFAQIESENNLRGLKMNNFRYKAKNNNERLMKIKTHLQLSSKLELKPRKVKI